MMSEKLQGSASEVARDLEKRYRSLRDAASQRSSRSFLNLAAVSFIVVGSLIAYSFRSESLHKLGIGLLLASVGVGVAAWARRHLSGEPLDPPERLPALGQLLKTAEQLSTLPFPVELEIDLVRVEHFRGTCRQAVWTADLEWDHLGTFHHDRTEHYQELTPLEKREQLSGKLTSSDLRGRPWKEGNVRATVHTKRLLLRVELEGWGGELAGSPSQHLTLHKRLQTERGTAFLWEFPKNHSEREGLGHQGRPDLGVPSVNRHHPEFLGEQIGQAIAWMLERTESRQPPQTSDL